MSTIETILQNQQWPVTFNTLASAIRATGLEYTTQGSNQVTFFAPSDLAFDKLRLGMIYDMLKDVMKLRHLLQYHLVPLKLTTADMMQFASATASQNRTPSDGENPDTSRVLQLETASNQLLRVTLSPQGCMVEDARVTQPDIIADNGVIHVIDTVLWPPDLSEDYFPRTPASPATDQYK